MVRFHATPWLWPAFRNRVPGGSAPFGVGVLGRLEQRRGNLGKTSMPAPSDDDMDTSGPVGSSRSDDLDLLIERAKAREREEYARAEAEADRIAALKSSARRASTEPSVRRFLQIMESHGNRGLMRVMLEEPKTGPNRGAGRLRNRAAIARVPKIDVWTIHTERPPAIHLSGSALLLDTDGHFRWRGSSRAWAPSRSMAGEPLSFEPRFAQYLATYLVENRLA
jgi:hypothetical protein